MQTLHQFCCSLYLKALIHWCSLEMSMFSTSHAGPLMSCCNPQLGPQSATILQLLKQSGQWPRETWEEFFTCQSHAHLEKRSGESAPDREACQQCTEYTRGGQCLGKQVWMSSTGELDGVQIHTLVGYRRYMAIWDDFHGTQQCYDPFFNEWDLCSELDPTTHLDLGEEGDDMMMSQFLQRLSLITTSEWMWVRLTVTLLIYLFMYPTQESEPCEAPYASTPSSMPVVPLQPGDPTDNTTGLNIRWTIPVLSSSWWMLMCLFRPLEKGTTPHALCPNNVHWSLGCYSPFSSLLCLTFHSYSLSTYLER